MAYDVEFTAGINDAAVQRSLEKVRTAEVRHAAAMRREASRSGLIGAEARAAAGRLVGGRFGGFVSGGAVGGWGGWGGGGAAVGGIAGGAAALGFIARTIAVSTERYSKFNERAAEAMLMQERSQTRFSRSWSRFWDEFGGRRLTSLRTGLAGGAAGVLDSLARARLGSAEFDRRRADEDRARAYQTGITTTSLGSRSASNILARTGRGDQAGIVEELSSLISRNEEIRRQRQGNTIDNAQARLLYRLSEQDFRTGIVSNFQSSFYSGIGGGASRDVVDSIAGAAGSVAPPAVQSIGGDVGQLVVLMRQLVEIQKQRQVVTVGR